MALDQTGYIREAVEHENVLAISVKALISLLITPSEKDECQNEYRLRDSELINTDTFLVINHV